MKKVITLMLAFVVLTTNAFSFVGPKVDRGPMIEIASGVKVTPEELLTMTPKEYRKLTGKRMGLLKSIAFKMVQKKALKQMKKDGDGAEKNQILAAVLCFFVGGLGIHRFYLGYTWQGIVQILTLGGLGIWVLIDFIRILTGDLQPKNGEYTKGLI